MGSGHKIKNPGPIISIRDVPFLSHESTWLTVVHADTAVKIQAGLLTFGSSYRLRLPIPLQWINAAFVPDYSGGPVPDSHEVPYCALMGAPGFS